MFNDTSATPLALLGVAVVAIDGNDIVKDGFFGANDMLDGGGFRDKNMATDDRNTNKINYQTQSSPFIIVRACTNTTTKRPR
jgi:hypothetical protein